MSTGNRNINPDDASRWFARMQDDQRTPADEAEFDRWLAEDPAHERQYQRLQQLWGNLEHVRHDAPIRTLRADALDETRIAALTRKRLPKAMMLAAGVAAVAVVFLFGDRFIPTDQQYQTAVGERRTLQLPDGSELILNTDTQAHVRYTLRTRTVALERGQARFRVARSKLRPFVVNAGTGIIRALGTEFDVYRKNDEVRIALIEGIVSVTPASAPAALRGNSGAQSAAERARDRRSGEDSAQILLSAGQSLALTPLGIAATPPGRIQEATAWLDGKLIFNDEHLRDAVAEVNRYSTQKIVVLDGDLADLRVNGVFRTDRADSFIEAVRTSLPVLVQKASGGTLVIVPDPDRGAEAHPPH